MKINKKINLFLCIFSIYYIPYLIFSWGGVAGVKEGTVPFFYKNLQVILPITYIFLINKKHFIQKEASILCAIFIFAVVIFIMILKIEYLNNEIIKILIFFFIYIFLGNINYKDISMSNLKILIFFSFIITIIEKYYLEKFFFITPLFFSTWQERCVGNMGGPNTLGAYINILYTLLIFSNIRYKYIYTFIASIIILWTDSDGAMLVFFIINIYKILIIKRIYIYVLILFGSLGSIFKINEIREKIKNILSDGSNLDRINNFVINIKHVSLFPNLDDKYFSSESPYLEILFNYGIIMFTILVLLYIYIYIYIIKIQNKELKIQKIIIYIQMIIYSFISPVIYIFPLNILYITILKLKEDNK